MKQTVYHGSTEQVRHPEIRESDRLLDYGKGFYTTTSEEQATLWVKRKLGKAGGTGYVNVYEVDDGCYAHLRILRFDTPTEEWLDFVMANRTDESFVHDYDLVYGPVADDRVYAAFALYENGVLNKKELIAELKTYVLVDQWLFHTQRALEYLIFKHAKEISI